MLTCLSVAQMGLIHEIKKCKKSRDTAITFWTACILNLPNLGVFSETRACKASVSRNPRKLTVSNVSTLFRWCFYRQRTFLQHFLHDENSRNRKFAHKKFRKMQYENISTNVFGPEIVRKFLLYWECCKRLGNFLSQCEMYITLNIISYSNTILFWNL